MLPERITIRVLHKHSGGNVVQSSFCNLGSWTNVVLLNLLSEMLKKGLVCLLYIKLIALWLCVENKMYLHFDANTASSTKSVEPENAENTKVK